MKKIYILLALSFCFLTFQAQATVYRVKTAGTSTGAGTWASPMDLQTALNAASADNAASSSVVSEVWIAQGTYYPTLRPDSGIAGTSNMARSFYIDHDVEIYGGFQNSGTPAWADRNVAGFPVILSGDLGTTGTNTDNCNHVFLGLNLTDATIIDGLTIQDGYSSSGYNSAISYSSNTFYGTNGPGMYLIGSDPILNNLVFQNNSCSSGGGGIMCTSSSPAITNVVFWKNNAHYGGALHAASSSYPIMTFITFYANTTTNRGGAVYINSSSTATIINTIFSGNTGNNGPDIYRQVTTSSFYITNSMMQQSSGSYTGTNYTITTATALIYSGAPSFYNAASTSASLAGSDGLWMSSDDGLSLASSSSSAYQYGTTGSGIPTTDITGATRGTTPCIGAYEVYIPQSVLYVDVNAIGNQTGTSWANAFTDLQEALDSSMARSGINTVLIAEGTYYPTQSPDGTTTDARDRAFHLADSNVVIIGGYDATAGTQTGGATILSGDLITAGTASDSAYHVFITKGLSASTVIDKITITAGKANGSSYLSYPSVTFLQNQGGGMHNYYSSPTLTNCVFTSNRATDGGGMYNSSSSPTLTNCVFTSNSATDGGGMYNYSSSPTLTNCAFTSNNAPQGGGMRNYFVSSPTLTNTYFFKNTASTSGPAIYNINNSSLNISSTHNASDADSALISGAGLIDSFFLDLSTKYYKDLFADSADLDGADNIWGTIDDGLHLTANSVLRGSGKAAGGPSLDISGATRPNPPSIGPYNCSLTSVTTEPVNALLCAGLDTLFALNTAGTDTSFQWQINTGSGWADVGGATNDTILLNTVTTSQNGNLYRAVVRGTCGLDTTNIVTLTVNGNPSITNISSSRNPTANGYAPYQCTDLTATVTGGTGSLNYAWSPSGSGNPLNVCPTVGTWYKATVTDANGCADTMSFKQAVMEATSPYSGRVIMCYNYPRRAPMNINIYPSQVPKYLNAGAKLGKCGSSPSKRNMVSTYDDIYRIYPNPANNQIALEWFNLFNEEVTIDLVDMTGRVVKNIFNGQVLEGEINLITADLTELPVGMYFMRYSSPTDVRINKVQLMR